MTDLHDWLMPHDMRFHPDNPWGCPPNCPYLHPDEVRLLTKHDYTSTACMHELHPRCRHDCKYCGAQCACSCHEGDSMSHANVGRVAYEAYRRQAEGVSLISGAPLPDWDRLADSIQQSWIAAALAARAAE